MVWLGMCVLLAASNIESSRHHTYSSTHTHTYQSYSLQHAPHTSIKTISRCFSNRAPKRVCIDATLGAAVVVNATRVALAERDLNAPTPTVLMSIRRFGHCEQNTNLNSTDTASAPAGKVDRTLRYAIDYA